MARSIQTSLDTLEDTEGVLLSLAMTHPGSPRLGCGSLPLYPFQCSPAFVILSWHAQWRACIHTYMYTIRCVVCTHQFLRAVCNRWMTSGKLVIPSKCSSIKLCWIRLDQVRLESWLPILWSSSRGRLGIKSIIMLRRNVWICCQRLGVLCEILKSLDRSSWKELVTTSVVCCIMFILWDIFVRKCQTVDLDGVNFYEAK